MYNIKNKKVSIQGKISIYLSNYIYIRLSENHLRRFMELGKHDDCRHTQLPRHPPEIRDGVLEGALGGHVSQASTEALERREGTAGLFFIGIIREDTSRERRV